MGRMDADRVDGMCGGNAVMMDVGKQTLPADWRWVRLGDVLRLRKEIVHPYDAPEGPATFVGLEHIETGTGRRTGSECLEMARLEGRKPRFYRGDIVYGYLRPYLNKVWVAEFDGLCSVDQYVYSIDQEQASAEFVAWFMGSPAYFESAPTGRSPGQLPRIRTEEVASVDIALPPLDKQRRIAAVLKEQMAAADRARAAAEEQNQLLHNLTEAILKQSFSTGPIQRLCLSDCLEEISKGVGTAWRQHRVVGATRDGIALAKEPVGKQPERYKFIESGTIFYNPMRILIGSIAAIDEGDEPGITSPDYVAFRTRPGILHPRWFYFWLRSGGGAAFIKTLARGAVRERMLFRRLSQAHIELPPWDAQLAVAGGLRMVSELRARVTGQLAAINSLPAALLRRAFSGAF
jgi:type I restriction enzyme S subunit